MALVFELPNETYSLSSPFHVAQPVNEWTIEQSRSQAGRTDRASVVLAVPGPRFVLKISEVLSVSRHVAVQAGSVSGY